MGWWMVMGGLWFIVFWAVIIGLVAWGVRAVSGNNRRRDDMGESPLEIAKRRLVVTNVRPLAWWSETDILRFAAAKEAGSEHPLARAMVEAATHRSLGLPAVSQFQAVPGYGLRGQVAGYNVLMGNRRLMATDRIATTVAEDAMSALEAQGKTAMLIAVDGTLAGIVAVADTTKPEAQEALAAPRRLAPRHAHGG